MSMNIFSRLDPDIMHTHILPRLDGTTLTVLSSISSELRHMIRNNEDLCRKLCTSKWPSLLLDPIVNIDNVISTFPCGYRSFFSHVFPSLHRHNNNCCHPPSTELIHAVDIYVHGEPWFSRVWVETLNIKFHFFECTTWDSPTIHIPVQGNWAKCLKENVTLSWIVIDPTHKRATNLIRSSYNTSQVSENWDENMTLRWNPVVEEDQVWTKIVLPKVIVKFYFNGKERCGIMTRVMIGM